MGACCPPPDARHKTFFPFRLPNHPDGTLLLGVRMTRQMPCRAAWISSELTAWHQRLPVFDSLFHAALLCVATSILSNDPAHLLPPTAVVERGNNNRICAKRRAQSAGVAEV